MLATNLTNKIIHAAIYNCRDDRIKPETNSLKDNIQLENKVLEWHTTVQQFNNIIQGFRPSIPCG
jgi:methionyl-tRNA formyltransferase